MSDNQVLEDIRTWLIVGIISGLALAIIYNGGGLMLFVGLGALYNLIYYDLLGNETFEEKYGAITAVQQAPPIDDCRYSDDEQLCYQMKRIADALEKQNGSINVQKLDRYGYPIEWERNYENCLIFDDYPDCPQELLDYREQLKQDAFHDVLDTSTTMNDGKECFYKKIPTGWKLSYCEE